MPLWRSVGRWWIVFPQRTKIKVFTHSIDGLTENDFILAAKVDLV